MQWVKSYTNTLGRREFRKLSRTLGTRPATTLGHLEGLKQHVGANELDGVLDGYDADDIADASLWEGDPQVMLEALLLCGIIERTETGYLMLKWDEEQGAKCDDIRRYERDRKRVQRQAAKEAKQALLTCPGNVPDKSVEQSRAEQTREELNKAASSNEARLEKDAPAQEPPLLVQPALPAALAEWINTPEELQAWAISAGLTNIKVGNASHRYQSQALPCTNSELVAARKLAGDTAGLGLILIKLCEHVRKRPTQTKPPISTSAKIVRDKVPDNKPCESSSGTDSDRRASPESVRAVVAAIQRGDLRAVRELSDTNAQNARNGTL